MVGVGGIGILDHLQNTNDLAATCSNCALSHKRQLDRHLFELLTL